MFTGIMEKLIVKVKTAVLDDAHKEGPYFPQKVGSAVEYIYLG